MMTRGEMMKRTITLVLYDDWNHHFEVIKDVLKDIFSNQCIGIYHIGSTAIPGMPAKPIIDVMVTVNDINSVDALNETMKKAHYIPKGENGIPGRRYYQKFAADGIEHVEHIHCFEQDNPLVKEHLIFRDYLRIDKEAFDAYLAVKTEAAKRYPFNPDQYTKYKSDCIKRILKRARTYFLT
jgi:GrpB-like predicted nucleotidyltransferase (UPF0157 family)